MDFLAMARRLRQLVMEQAQSFTDEEALDIPFAYPKWAPDTEYHTGERVRYREDLYKVLQNHTSQDGWNPEDAPSLWAKVLIPDPGVIPDWVQPGSTNAYMTGDKVKHNGKTWVSIVDYNVWEPGVYGWEEVV